MGFHYFDNLLVMNAGQIEFMNLVNGHYFGVTIFLFNGHYFWCNCKVLMACYISVGSSGLNMIFFHHLFF